MISLLSSVNLPRCQDQARLTWRKIKPTITEPKASEQPLLDKRWRQVLDLQENYQTTEKRTRNTFSKDNNKLLFWVAKIWDNVKILPSLSTDSFVVLQVWPCPNCFMTTYQTIRSQGPVSRRSRNDFAPKKLKQNLKPLDNRAVLFIYSLYEQKFSLYKTFQVYRPLSL